MEEYIVRQRVNLNSLSDTEKIEHIRQQKKQANAKYYKKRKSREMYYINIHNEINDILNDEDYDGEDEDLFLDCVRICKEELNIV